MLWSCFSGSCRSLHRHFSSLNRSSDLSIRGVFPYGWRFSEEATVELRLFIGAIQDSTPSALLTPLARSLRNRPPPEL